MKAYFTIHSTGLEKASPENYNFKIYKAPSKSDKENFIQKYHLPKDVFYFDNMPEIAPRIESLKNEILGDLSIFVISNVISQKESHSVEMRLESHTFILSDKKLFWFMDGNSSGTGQMLAELQDKNINSLESIIMKIGLLAYKNFASELEEQKNKIDQFHKSAINSTSNVVLTKLADTERDMVMLQHTIDTQEHAFEKLLASQSFTDNLNNESLVYDIRWYNRQVKQLIVVYRDLLDATSSLFTDIMGNNLNQLMKSLTTVSLVLAAATFIPGLWGINTGGLPFGQSKFGFLFVALVSLLAGISMHFYLKQQDHFEE